MESIFIAVLLTESPPVDVVPLKEVQGHKRPYITVQRVGGFHVMHQHGAEGTIESKFLMVCRHTSFDAANAILEPLGQEINGLSGEITVSGHQYAILGVFVEDDTSEFVPPAGGDDIGDPAAHKLVTMWHQQLT
jgi:hypothetical protein